MASTHLPLLTHLLYGDVTCTAEKEKEKEKEDEEEEETE